MTPKETMLVLDFGSQYTQLIARRVREGNVYSEILPYNTPVETIRKYSPRGLILSGSPSSVTEAGAPVCDRSVFELGIPVLGLCYGMQLMTHLLGGDVGRAHRREFGRSDLRIDDDSDLFQGIARDSGSRTPVWMSHGDRIERMPQGFDVIGHTENSPVAAMRDTRRRLYALQFHPEVAHTPEGKTILENFVRTICGCEPTWTMASFIENSIAQIRSRIGSRKVVCALSGGVDSSVAAVLVHRAVGDQLTCLFVDNGLLRQGEARRVMDLFRRELKLNIRAVDAGASFLRKLKGVRDPEKKRRIIGREFIRVFEQETKEIGSAEFLVQGTLYPDVIESVSFKGPSATIKSHHNVGGLPKRMRLKLIEPLRELFKDEVRRVGADLGLPAEIVWRQPFPGPGLAVRILGEIDDRRLELLRLAEAIVDEEISGSGLGKEVWQAFAVLLPIKTVGVMGDERTYENVIALRAVSSVDGMTADWVRLPYDLLARISSRIINEVKGVNRVVYDVSSKPPSTIEWE